MIRRFSGNQLSALLLIALMVLITGTVSAVLWSAEVLFNKQLWNDSHIRLANQIQQGVSVFCLTSIGLGVIFLVVVAVKSLFED